jgi:hypothetical protein
MSPTTTYTSPIELYRKGVAILTDQLGPVDSIRLLLIDFAGLVGRVQKFVRLGA